MCCRHSTPPRLGGLGDDVLHVRHTLGLGTLLLQAVRGQRRDAPVHLLGVGEHGHPELDRSLGLVVEHLAACCAHKRVELRRAEHALLRLVTQEPRFILRQPEPLEPAVIDQLVEECVVCQLGVLQIGCRLPQGNSRLDLTVPTTEATLGVAVGQVRQAVRDD